MTGNQRTELSSSPITRLNIINLIAYTLNVLITYGIGVAGLFDLPTNGDLSRKYQTLVTPVGWAFSIWGLIFTFQLVWVVFQTVSKQNRNSEWISAIGMGYFRICVAQAAWTLAFSNEAIWLSLGFMVLILVFLVEAVLSLIPKQASVGDYVLWKLPFTLHCGWILAATVVNLNVVLVAEGFSTNIQFLSAVGSLASLFLIGVFTAWRHIDYVIPIVVAWALLGVYVELGSAAASIVISFERSQIDQARYGAIIVSSALILATLVKGAFSLCQGRSDASTEESRYLRQDH
jgi:hypothetical protein